MLAEQAGLLLGCYPADDMFAPIKHQAAELLIAAGADRAAVEGWIKVGQERAAAAGFPPFSRPRTP